MKIRTALVRTQSSNLKIFRYDDYRSNTEMAEDLRGNGYKVLKIWAQNKSDAEVDEWAMLYRK